LFHRFLDGKKINPMVEQFSEIEHIMAGRANGQIDTQPAHIFQPLPVRSGFLPMQEDPLLVGKRLAGDKKVHTVFQGILPRNRAIKSFGVV
jgi:hypothetical protein